MAPHPSPLAWKIPWAEEPGGLQSMGSRRVGHDWATSLSLLTFMHWRRTWQPTPVFLPGESQVWGAWWAAIYGVAQSQTWLKWVSSSSSSSRQFAWGTIRQNLLSYTVKKKQNQDRDWECLQSPGIKQGLECYTPVSNPTAIWEKFWLRERKSPQPLKSLDPCLRLAPGFEHVPSSSWKWW